MELEDALNQIDKLEEQVQVAVKAGGDEVLHTVMEIRQNPYDDFDEGAGANQRDLSVDIASSPFQDDLGGNLGQQRSGGFGISIPPSVLGSNTESNGLTNKGNIKMNLGLHNKTEGKYRAKKKIAAMGIPSLDLSTLKNVKEFKDWYGYSQKLENAIRLLREKNDALEKEIDMKDLHIMKIEKTNEN